jgi:uncharacterized protein YkwD
MISMQSGCNARRARVENKNVNSRGNAAIFCRIGYLYSRRTMKCGGLSLVAFLTTLAIAAPVTSAASQSDVVVSGVNATRAQHGLKALHRSGILDRSAALKAREIVRCHVFSHTPCGVSFRRTFQATGYLRGHARVGENLYWGGGSLGSPDRAIAAWLASPPHRANLFGRGWRDVGVATVHAPSLFGAGDVWLYVLQFGRH